MEGYKNFVDGCVSKVLVHQVRRCSGEGVSKQVTVVSASVKHSQWLSDTPLKPWVPAEMMGTVVRAHCTCMAGLGEGNGFAQVARKLFRKDVKDSSSDQYVGNFDV